MKFNLISLLVLLLPVFSACGTSSTGGDAAGGDTVTNRAGLLTLVDFDGYSVATVKNPWDTARVLAKYLLVPRDMSADSVAMLPKGTVVKVPLDRSLVYSSVHGGAIVELGCTDRIAAVADGQYFSLPAIRNGLKDGNIKDVGNSMSPSVEMIVELNPDAILTSPYNNSGHGAIESLGIPVVEMADYMEATPLGRAEWIKLLGRLYGKAAESDSVYAAVERSYHALAASLASVTDKPVVITEQPVNGVWALPGGKSYAATLLRDAGGAYPWASDDSAGSIEQDPAAVLDRAESADFWFIRSFGPLTAGGLQSNFPLASKFKAMTVGGVYVCDTSASPLFDEFPFHPERLLMDYAVIMHPSLFPGATPRYFHKLR